MNTEEKKLKNNNIENTFNKQDHEDKINNDNIKNINLNELNELKEKLFNNQKKINDIKLRHLAYIDNINKDTEIAIKNIQNTKKEKFFKKIIPIIDDLENILSCSKQLKLDQEPLIQGIQLTLKSLLKIIYKFGVKIEGKKNDIFNPNLHDIILTENSTEIQPNHIILVTRQGFSFNNITLRKALVIISKK